MPLKVRTEDGRTEDGRTEDGRGQLIGALRYAGLLIVSAPSARKSMNLLSQTRVGYLGLQK